MFLSQHRQEQRPKLETYLSPSVPYQAYRATFSSRFSYLPRRHGGRGIGSRHHAALGAKAVCTLGFGTWSTLISALMQTVQTLTGPIVSHAAAMLAVAEAVSYN